VVRAQPPKFLEKRSRSHFEKATEGLLVHPLYSVYFETANCQIVITSGLQHIFLSVLVRPCPAANSAMADALKAEGNKAFAAKNFDEAM
jgi:hypothetical protein